MGIVGGEVGYQILRVLYPGGGKGAMSGSEVFGDPGDPNTPSKLKLFFGESFYDHIQGKNVLEFGCGKGYQAVEMTLHGARTVIGLDIVEANLESGWDLARRHGIADRCTFAKSCDRRVDVVISVDSFEHFSDPAGVLRQMRAYLKDDGYALVTTGYTWYHPMGGHLFSVFPWAHLIFTESALIRWRSEFKSDGATRFHEVEGGLGQLTIAKWERFIAESPFEVEWQKLRPIKPARLFHNSLTKEFFTSTLQCKLVPRKCQVAKVGTPGATKAYSST